MALEPTSALMAALIGSVGALSLCGMGGSGTSLSRLCPDDVAEARGRGSGVIRRLAPDAEGVLVARWWGSKRGRGSGSSSPVCGGGREGWEGHGLERRAASALPFAGPLRAAGAAEGTRRSSASPSPSKVVRPMGAASVRVRLLA